MEGCVVLSMTGFGRGERSDNGTTVTVEVHSVNGRYCDVRTRLPRELMDYEGAVRGIAQEYIARGKVNVTVNVDRGNTRVRNMRADAELAARYYDISREIAEKCGIENTMSVSSLMSMPDVIVNDESVDDAESLWERIEGAARDALDSHHAMRSQEGEKLAADLLERLDAISTLIGEIEKIVPDVIQANRDRFRKRLETLLNADEFDEMRFTMEAAVLSDRLDVTEECVRFRSHNEQFADELGSDKASGRKLVFLLQEMNREANTIGSKIMDASTAQTVVRIKEELEKMREQAENME